LTIAYRQAWLCSECLGAASGNRYAAGAPVYNAA
jgi:hypothetical protein